MTNGKHRLIAAAARLIRQDPIAMPGLREIARAAGLNHNTFYRHFQDMNGLRDTAVTALATELQAHITRLRLATAPFPPDALITTVFDLAASQPDTFTLAYRALHGGACPAQTTMRDLTAALSAALAADLTALDLLPPRPNAARLARLLQAHIAHILTLAMRLIETPPARDALLAQAGEHLSVLLAGLTKNRLLAAHHEPAAAPPEPN